MKYMAASNAIVCTSAATESEMPCRKEWKSTVGVCCWRRVASH